MATIPLPHCSRKYLHTATVVDSNHTPTPSLDDLYSNYRDFIYSVALRITHNTHDAEDIVQNVFLRMLRNQTGPEAGRAAGGYFRRSATNASIDLIRMRTQRAEEMLESHYRAPDSTFVEHRYVQQVLDQLSSENAELFQFHYRDGHPYDEVAERFDMRIGTVKSRLHRIRATLQEKLTA